MTAAAFNEEHAEHSLRRQSWAGIAYPTRICDVDNIPRVLAEVLFRVIACPMTSTRTPKTSPAIGSTSGCEWLAGTSRRRTNSTSMRRRVSPCANTRPTLDPLTTFCSPIGAPSAWWRRSRTSGGTSSQRLRSSQRATRTPNSSGYRTPSPSLFCTRARGSSHGSQTGATRSRAPGNYSLSTDRKRSRPGRKPQGRCGRASTSFRR